MGNDQKKNEISHKKINKQHHNKQNPDEVISYSDNEEISDNETEKEINNIIKYDLNDDDDLNRSRSVNQIKRKKKKYDFDSDDYDSNSNDSDDDDENRKRKKKKKKKKKKKDKKNKEKEIDKNEDLIINEKEKEKEIDKNEDLIINEEEEKNNNSNEKIYQNLNINEIYSNEDNKVESINLDNIDYNNEIIKPKKKIAQSVLPSFHDYEKLNIEKNRNSIQNKQDFQNKKKDDDLLNYYKNQNNNNYKHYHSNNEINPFEEEKKNRIIPQYVYEKIDKRDLRIVIVCMQKCNEKYEEGLNLYKNSLYFQALENIIKARNSYMKLKDAIQQRSDSYPAEFQQIMTIKIGEKVSKINETISKISPLASQQKYSLYSHYKNKNSKNINIIQSNNNYGKFIDNILNNPIRNQNNQNQNINKYPNSNIINQKPNYPNYNESTSEKSKKNIHTLEEDEMDAKIESEIMITNPGVKFSDIVGMEELKQMVYEIIIIPTIRPDLFTGVLKPQRGILLFGPPGTGKTMIAKAIASECSCTFFNISASSLTSKWVGESEKTVRSLFKLAYKKAPSIIFIDDIDSILSKRSENDNDAAKRLKTEFLIQFDGLGSNSNAKLLVIAATNRPMDLDDALLRRLPKRVYCHPLNEKGRFEFIRKLINTVDNNLKDDEIMVIAKETFGYSNGDLQELCREAAYEPVRELSTQEILKIEKFRDVTFQDLKKAVLKIRGTLSQKVVKEMEDWNNQFGGI